MSKSIYTEYANLTPYHTKWLDGCGATWAGGDKFSEMKFIIDDCISFTSGSFYQSPKIYYRRKDAIHLPTGDAFCQGVAEILGIEYVPEKPFTRKLINKLELHDKMERPLPEGTISKTETVTDDKGLAIDVKLLSEKDREWLGINFCVEIAFKYWAYIGYEVGFIYGDNLNDNIPITTDPTEFMRYVADKTGKEYIKNLTITPEIKEKIQPKIKERHIKASQQYNTPNVVMPTPTYPHKTYRVLDSLDGVPLDRRIPLSEWIPPFGTKVKFEFPDNIIYGRVNLISKDGIEVLGKFFKCTA